MKTISKILFLILVAAVAGSCEEPAGAAFVYGHISINPGDPVDFQGELSTSGASDVYGSCKVSKDGTLEFTVGHAPKADLDQLIGVEPEPTFLSVSGIKGPNDGPPVQGVFDLSGATTPPLPKSDTDALRSNFYRAEVKNKNDSWSFLSDGQTCYVNLYAVPIEGEIIFDLDKTFDYYVRLTCSGMPSLTGDNGENLRSVNAELYFENCK